MNKKIKLEENQCKILQLIILFVRTLKYKKKWTFEIKLF